MASLEEETNQLLTEVSSPTISKPRIIEILDEHSNCFEADLCDICEYIDEEVLTGLLETLAANPVIDDVLQNRIYEESVKWQGQEISVLIEYAGNPSVSDNFKAHLLSPELWFGYDEGRELVGLFIERASKNSRFSKSEIEEFLNTCNDVYDYR